MNNTNHNQDNNPLNLPPIQFAKEILPISLEEEMKTSYLDYAMSVIVGRALPDVRDGLKPVHRRVLFAMNELGNDWNKAYKKSARIVGDVIGKYHPHGDQAVYDTIVRLAQNFSMRYCLVDGQGNFGSVDGDGAAAMRYTEIRMAKIGHQLLEDLDKETVDFGANYDGSEQEPLVLPTRLPNLLVNGSAGIAVGMATNIPPHNLNEVINACLAMLENPQISVEELMQYIPAPDFPTAALIYGVAGIKEAYKTGRGRIIIRSKVHLENIGKNNNRQAIVVDEIPYQVNKKALIEKIAELVNDKKIDGISNIQDESDKSGMRIVIELKRGENSDVVLNNLYKQTQLQDSFGVNMVALVNGQPKLLNLQQIIHYFLLHRREVITRRTIFDLRKARERGHILEGLAIALNNVDEIIALIKSAENPALAKKMLIEKSWQSDVVLTMLNANSASAENFDKTQFFHEIRPENLDDIFGFNEESQQYLLSDFQAQAILDLKLQRLTGLEKSKIINEYKEIISKILDFIDILKTPKRVDNIIADELNLLRQQFSGDSDKRRSEIVINTQELNTEDLITPEDMIVTMSHSGYIKSQPLADYQSQRRGGRGRRATNIKDEDFIDQLFAANTHDYLMCFSNRGRCYVLRVFDVPQGNYNARGKPIVNLFPALQEGEKISAVLAVKRENFSQENHYIFMATKLGTVKKSKIVDFANVRRNGVNAINLHEGDDLIGVSLTDGNSDIVLVSDAGKAIWFNESEVRSMGRSAAGVKGMRLKEKQNVLSLLVASGNDEEKSKYSILVATENGFGKRSALSDFRQSSRAAQGVIAIANSERNGSAIAACLVQDEDQIMLITTNGVMIRTRVSEMREMGRNTQGVKIISLGDGEKLVGMEKVISDSDDDNENAENSENN